MPVREDFSTVVPNQLWERIPDETNGFAAGVRDFRMGEHRPVETPSEFGKARCAGWDYANMMYDKKRPRKLPIDRVDIPYRLEECKPTDISAVRLRLQKDGYKVKSEVAEANNHLWFVQRDGIEMVFGLMQKD